MDIALRIGLTRDTRLIKAFLRKIKGQLRPLPYKQWQRVGTDGFFSFEAERRGASRAVATDYYS